MPSFASPHNDELKCNDEGRERLRLHCCKRSRLSVTYVLGRKLTHLVTRLGFIQLCLNIFSYFV
jgi:hypothetical protein